MAENPVNPGDSINEPRGRGHDPDKTTGRERAAEVHERNAERKEADDTINEPDPEQLPAKPTIEDMPPPTGEDPPADDEEEEVPDEEYLDEEEAEEDDTVDDTEGEEEPHTDLPKGAKAEDYDDE